MNSKWYFSLISNSLALGLSFLFGILYTSLRLKIENRKNPDSDSKIIFKWYDYIISFIIVVIGAFIPYYIIYKLTGYIPMGKIKKGIIY